MRCSGIRILSLMALLAFLLSSPEVLSQSSETYYWSAPKLLGLNRVMPAIGLLSDGTVVIASIDSKQIPFPTYYHEQAIGDLYLGFYDPNGNLIREVQVDEDVTFIQPPFTYDVAPFMTIPYSDYIDLDISSDDRITLMYNRYADYYWSSIRVKQYSRDGSVILGPITLFGYSSRWSLINDVTVTDNGDIHTINWNTNPMTGFDIVDYRRFDRTGQLINTASLGLPAQRSDTDITDMQIARATSNSVFVAAMGYQPGSRLDPGAYDNKPFLWRITDGVPGQVNAAAPGSREAHCGYNNPGCYFVGLSMAVNNEKVYLAYTYHSGYGSVIWRPELTRYDQMGTPSFIPGFTSGVSRDDWRTSSADLIPSAEVLAEGNNWYYIWADKRAGGAAGGHAYDMFIEKQDDAGRVFVNDAPLAFTRNEDLLKAALGPDGTIYIVYTNGFVRKAGAESVEPALYFTKSSTSKMTLSENPVAGRPAAIDISSPATPNKPYVFFASFNQGITPLGNGNIRALPVQADLLFFLSITSPGLIFSNSQGTLNSNGNAQITFTPPVGSEGLTMYLGFVVYDANGISLVSLANREVIGV